MRNKNLSGNLFTKPKKGVTITEAALSASICEYLDLKHIYNDRLNSGMIRLSNRVVWLCKKGTPDRFAIVKGIIIFIEVKQLHKLPTEEQLARHIELRKAGAVVIVADSFDSFTEQFNSAIQSISKTLPLSP